MDGRLAKRRLSDEQRQRLIDLLNELHEIYRLHIAVEDAEVFPLAAGTLNAEQLRQLGKEMAERRGLASETVFTNDKGGATMSTKTTIDVRTIPGAQRHPLIFSTFDGLQVGGALEIVNDHDPFPLHNQFNFMKNGQFDWQYLQQGPGLWRVRIGKAAKTPVQ